MKPILFHNPKSTTQSFFVMNDKVSYFYDTLHYHPEFQLTFIIEGTGHLLLGDYIGRFEPGDIFLIGSNIAHVFKSDNEYYDPKNKLKSHAISVYFNIDSFGELFFDLPENKSIKSLLSTSQRGIKVIDSDTGDISTQLLGLNHLEGLERLTAFLLCLDQLSKQRKNRLILTSGELGFANKEEDNNRMDKVTKYILQNFTKEIKLETVAQIAYMTPNAFCRFFSRKTRKTLSEFIMEARIGYARKLLLQEKFSVLEIAYACGYNNISNFNRQFKKIMKVTPTEYLKEMIATGG